MSKTIFNKGTRLTFGKYKGVTVEKLIEDNPEYLLWCHDNIEWFDLPDKLLFVLEDLIESREKNCGVGIMLDYDGTMLLEPTPRVKSDRCCFHIGNDCTCGEDDLPSGFSGGM